MSTSILCTTGYRAGRRLKPLLAAHRTGLLNYFDHRITTGKFEGFNNKIKVIKRQAYGYRNTDYFKLRIYISSPVQVRINRMNPKTLPRASAIFSFTIAISRLLALQANPSEPTISTMLAHRVSERYVP